MQPMYSEQSLHEINGKLKRRFTVLGIVLTVLLAVFVWAMTARVEWAAMTSLSLAGVFAIFFTDLFCLPLVRYRRLIRSALTGRRHMKSLEFARTEPDVFSVDGITCRGLIFLGDPDKHGSREMLLYWDNEIPLPELEPGTVYGVEFTGRNIIGLQKTHL